MASVVSTVVRIELARYVSDCNILMVDDDGTIYISYSDATIQRVSPTGTITHYAGLPFLGGIGENYADGTLATARFNVPNKMVKGPDGTLYVAETQRIRAIRGQNVTTLAGRGGEDPDVNIAGEVRKQIGFLDIIDGSGPAAHMSYIEDIWFDSTGKLMFWDEDVIRSVALDGTVTTVEFDIEEAWKEHATGQVVDGAGNAYYPSVYFDKIDGAAMIRRLPDGSKQGFGRLVAEGAEPQDGPLQTATFNQVTSLGYSQPHECLYTMERHIKPFEFERCILRKITLPPRPVTMQLMGEQIARQGPIPAELMAVVSAFTGSKDPKRVYMDASKNRGVALPRGGRRTRRRRVNRKKKSRRRRSTSS